MPTATIPAFQAGKYVTVTVVDYNPDGTTTDMAEVLQPSVSPTGIVTVSIDPTNNRKLKITGIAQGSAVVFVTANGVPAGSNLVLNVSVVAAPPDLSRVELGAVEGPF